MRVHPIVIGVKNLVTLGRLPDKRAHNHEVDSQLTSSTLALRGEEKVTGVAVGMGLDRSRLEAFPRPANAGHGNHALQAPHPPASRYLVSIAKFLDWDGAPNLVGTTHWPSVRETL